MCVLHHFVRTANTGLAARVAPPVPFTFVPYSVGLMAVGRHSFTTRRLAKRRGNSLVPPRLLIQQQRRLHQLLRRRHLDISPPQEPTTRWRLLHRGESSLHSLRLGERAHPPPLPPAMVGPGSGAGLACDAKLRGSSSISSSRSTSSGRGAVQPPPGAVARRGKSAPKSSGTGTGGGVTPAKGGGVDRSTRGCQTILKLSATGISSSHLRVRQTTGGRGRERRGGGTRKNQRRGGVASLRGRGVVRLARGA